MKHDATNKLSASFYPVCGMQVDRKVIVQILSGFLNVHTGPVYTPGFARLRKKQVGKDGTGTFDVHFISSTQYVLN